jgi:AraC-like DNA-binding protein
VTKKTGRPRAKVDAAQVEELASIFCSLAEIAAVVNCSVSTIQRRFAQAVEKGRERGKESLKRAQWKKAVTDGNPTMLIWLGKQHLDQKDRQVHEHTGELPPLTFRIEK